MLVVGGSGAFGSRLMAGVHKATDLDVVIAGRDLDRATATAAAPDLRVRAHARRCLEGGGRVFSGNRRICLSTGVLTLDAIARDLAPCRISTQACD